jgi:hypothetical protein
VHDTDHNNDDDSDGEDRVFDNVVDAIVDHSADEQRDLPVEHEGARPVAAENEDGNELTDDEKTPVAADRDQETPDVDSTEQPTLRPYNLRELREDRRTFKAAVSDPHSTKSYYAPNHAIQNFIFGHVMTQMSASVGIKKHGWAAVAALMAEFAQLENLDMYEPINPKTKGTEPH